MKRTDESYRNLAYEALALLNASCAVMSMAIEKDSFILAVSNLSATVEETHELLLRLYRLDSRSETH